MKRLIASEFQRMIQNRRNQLLIVFYLGMIILSCIFRYIAPGGSYDCVNYNVDLNRLNFSPFAFYEIRIEVMYLILPILFITSINYEQSIGAFRMYVTRPYKKYEFIISKWIVLTLSTFVLIFMTFIISTIFGYLFMPNVSSVRFYKIQQEFSMSGALLYTAKFFIIQFIIALCVLSISSIIGLVISNSIISILAVIAALVGLGLYIKPFEFLDKTTKYGFHVLSNTAPMSFYITLIITLLGGLLVSIFLWQKKDYLY
ncbi:ABC transporter permease [Clostridium coskatii]|uniref:ABC-2 family transporter protein n=1 Tax=Clostridium coskatii TaxID=1705578 RepID=A0A162LA48_9CLOT|nr:ABC transporter permease [Clostridium coskatii]OAA93292.1 ABC-2 family transporter protein [Clostridium coskatii]OBR95325.1 ABC-2 family transporter protein [Clostridium coskatii]